MSPKRLDPEIQERLDAGLYESAKQGDLDSVRAFVRQGANVNSRHTGLSDTALHRALHRLTNDAQGAHEIAKWLLKHGADINLVDDAEFSPWHMMLQKALRDLDLKWIELGVSHGADLEASTSVTSIKTSSYLTAMYMAQYDIAILLAKAGADLWRDKDYSPDTTLKRLQSPTMTSRVFDQKIMEVYQDAELLAEDLVSLQNGNPPAHADKLNAINQPIFQPAQEDPPSPYILFNADGMATPALVRLSGARLLPRLFAESAWQDAGQALAFHERVKNALPPYHAALFEELVDISPFRKIVADQALDVPAPWRDRVRAGKGQGQEKT